MQSLPDRDPQPERQYQYHDRGGRSAEPRLGGTRTERSDERRIMRPPGALQQNPPTRQLIGFLVHHIGLTPARCPLVPPRGTTASGADRRDPHGMVDLQFLGGRRASEDAHPRLARKIGAPERSRTPNPQIRSLVLYPIELRARAEQPSGLQIATPAGRGKQGGSKGRIQGVLHSDDHDPRIAKFIPQISEPVGVNGRTNEIAWKRQSFDRYSITGRGFAAASLQVSQAAVSNSTVGAASG
jgi:hypothetical protein